MNVKEGQWAIFEGNVVQVKRIEKGEVIEVSDGSFATSGPGLGLFPLTLSNKAFAEAVMACEKIARYGRPEEHRSSYSSAGLNHPDIHRRFATLHNACLSIPEEDTKARNEVLEEARKLAQQIYEAVRESSRKEIGGVRIWR